jgi:hypothetical protein
MGYSRQIRHGFANKSKCSSDLVRGQFDLTLYEGIQAVDELTGPDFLSDFLGVIEPFTDCHLLTVDRPSLELWNVIGSRSLVLVSYSRG